jgi:acyl-CoA thioesterase II
MAKRAEHRAHLGSVRHESAAEAFAELCDRLRPKSYGGGSFHAGPSSVNWGVSYGGLLVAQALAAASATVREGMWVRSLHCYMVQAGDGDREVNLDVSVVHDGRSSAWRAVDVVQREHLLLRLECMFAVDREGPDHQASLPDVAAPTSLVNAGRLLSSYDDTFRPWDQLSPFDLRYATPPPRLRAEQGAGEPGGRMWIGAAGPPPDDRVLAAALLTYATDMCMLDACLQPHGLWFGPGSASGFTLDHSIWFHAPARVDDWMLLVQDSPAMRGGRGLGTANLFARDGELLCSIAQLGTVRPR